MNSPGPHDDLAELVGAVLDGTADDDQRRRLGERLREDRAARTFYRRFANLHAALRSYGTTEPSVVAKDDSRVANGAAPVLSAEPARRFGTGALFALTAAATATVAMLLLSFFRPEHAAERVADGRSAAIATLSRGTGLRWGGGREYAVGASLAAGPLELTHGIAEITFRSGAVVLVEAPARFDVLNAALAFLHTGRLVARVPSGEIRFVVETPLAAVEDLGTEFGVGVDPSGETQVHVFAGAVLAGTRREGGGLSDRRRLEAGEALAIEPDRAPPREFVAAAERFVRTFPTEPFRELGGPLYNRSEFDAVHVVPAPGPVVVDGDLGEWDLGGTFRADCVPPYAETYGLEGTLMFDARFLYVAAQVRDPAPLRSVQEDYPFRGGSVIVRIATDRRLGWPLAAVSIHGDDRKDPQVGRRAADRSERIAHLTMWFHRPTARPRLDLAYGMDFHGRTVDPPGWQGAFRADADGRGYVMEYSVPWTLLHAGDDPPRAGDELATMWNVHWSDEEGRVCRGHMAEILARPDVLHPFLRGPAWGRAIFHRTGRLPLGTVRPRTEQP